MPVACASLPVVVRFQIIHRASTSLLGYPCRCRWPGRRCRLGLRGSGCSGRAWSLLARLAFLPAVLERLDERRERRPYFIRILGQELQVLREVLLNLLHSRLSPVIA